MQINKTKIRSGRLQQLLYKINPETGMADRKVYAYYHTLGVVTFELMPAGSNNLHPYQALLRTMVGAASCMSWIDLDRNPLETTIGRTCLQFLKACQK